MTQQRLRLTAYAAAIACTGRPLLEQMHLILGDGSTSSLRVAEYLPLLERIQAQPAGPARPAGRPAHPELGGRPVPARIAAAIILCNHGDSP